VTQGDASDKPFGFWAANLAYKFSPNLTGSATYLGSDSNNTSSVTLADGNAMTMNGSTVIPSRFSTWGLGLKYQATDWLFLAEYAKNTDSSWNNVVHADGSGISTDALVFQLNYKLADPLKPNSWQVYVQWHRVGEAMVDIAKLNGAYYQYPLGTTGLSYGVKYAIAKNVIAGVELQSLKWINGRYQHC